METKFSLYKRSLGSEGSREAIRSNRAAVRQIQQLPQVIELANDISSCYAAKEHQLSSYGFPSNKLINGCGHAVQNIIQEFFIAPSGLCPLGAIIVIFSCIAWLHPYY